MHEITFVVQPENMLFRQSGQDSSVCIADFGFAKFTDDTGLTTPCGIALKIVR
jgi:hypothetical protein